MSPLDFISLDLPEPVLQGIRDAGFVATTPIQEGTLPLALKGKDVAGQSQTGTGRRRPSWPPLIHPEVARVLELKPTDPLGQRRS
jgi:ATP-dependent RNA helicase RhlB